MNNGVKVTVTFKREEMDDDVADISYLQDTAGNYEGCTLEEITDNVAKDSARLQAYYNGDWRMIGIRAVATIWIQRPGYQTNYTLESSGLYGIESDSGEEYLNEVYAEECSQLREDIEAMKTAEFQS